ncbi:MAG TPA: hypothetical protein VIY54_05765 [Steroidobacteraceae bacterium]
MLAAVACVALSGCDRAASPAKVQRDVATANDAAARNDAHAAEHLADSDAAANKDMASAEDKADRKTADAAGDAVITQADGDHKIALAQCESLAGAAQRDCRKQADADLNAVKAKVKAFKTEQN